MADPKLPELHPCPTCGLSRSPLEGVPCRDCRRESDLCNATLDDGRRCIRRGEVFVLDLGGRLCPYCAEARRRRTASERARAAVGGDEA